MRQSAYTFTSRKKRHPFRTFIRILLSLMLLLALGNFIIGNQLQYLTQKVTVSYLAADIDGWSILLFSDLHGQQYGAGQSGIASKLGTVRVSSVVFAGDMLGKDGDPSALLALAALLPSDTPKLYLPGDDDPSYLATGVRGAESPYAEWAQQLVDAGITILDEPVLFTRGKKQQARIWFIPEYLYSLDLNSFVAPYQRTYNDLHGKEFLTSEEQTKLCIAEYQVARIARIRESLGSILDSDIQIAVTHVPLTSSYVREMLAYTSKDTVFSLRNVSLVLAGHLCAGQVRLPGLGAVSVPGYGSFPADNTISGLGYVSGISQYISPGLGASSTYTIPFRIMNPPAFTYITLTTRLTQ